MKNLYLPALFILLVIYSCKSKESASDDINLEARTLLLEADKSFSLMSEQKGMHVAYIDYIDSNGVLIRNNAQPILGANAIDYIIRQDDANFTFSRKPQHAELSQSGEMGFTYGIYAKKYHSLDTILYGSYSSIWKKQSDGKWKLLLDSENEGVGE